MRLGERGIPRGIAAPALVAVLVGLVAPAPAPAAEDRGPGRRAGYLGRIPPDALARAKARARVGSLAPGRTRPGAGRTALVPNEEVEFDGITGITGPNTISPSDTVGAVGPDKVVTAVNIEYAVYDKIGTELLGPNSLEDLFPGLPPSAFVFDPKVVYDHYTNRFVLMFLAARGFFGGEQRSWILVVTMPQATADDPSTWCKRRLAGDQVRGFGNLFADYPGFGFDRRRLYITTNQFTFDSEAFRYAQVLALRKSRLYDCDRTPKKEVFARGATRDPEGTRAFTIQPAVTETDTGAKPAEFMLSFQDTDFCSPGLPCGRRLTVWRFRERDGRLRLSKRSVGVGVAKLAPLGTQKDGSDECSPIAECWDTGDLRLINAFYDADEKLLYAAHAVFVDVAGPPPGYIESVVRWYEVDPAPWESTDLSRKGLIGEAGIDAGWPVVATDGDGNVFVTYSRAGAPPPGEEYLSAYVATIPPPPASPSTDLGVALLRAGEALFVEDGGTPQRWGDYNGISRDPADPQDVWTVNQYAKDNMTGGPPTDLWQQVVHGVSFVP